MKKKPTTRQRNHAQKHHGRNKHCSENTPRAFEHIKWRPLIVPNLQKHTGNANTSNETISKRVCDTKTNSTHEPTIDRALNKNNHDTHKLQHTRTHHCTDGRSQHINKRKMQMAKPKVGKFKIVPRKMSSSNISIFEPNFQKI